MKPPADFAMPDYGAPIDVAALKASLLPGGTIKGMFAQSIADAVKKAGAEPRFRSSWVGFKDYAIEEFVEFLVDGAAKVHPGVPIREAVRRLGRMGYATMASSLAGRVVFGVLGKDILAITKIVPKAYELAGKGSKATLIGYGDGWSHVRLDEVALADCYQVGAFEGVLDLCGMEGEVYVKALSPSSAELFTVWRPKAP